MDMEQFIRNIDVINEQNLMMQGSLSCIGNGLVHLNDNWSLRFYKGNLSESESISQCILQIAICKVRTLVSMCDGIIILNEFITKVLDIPSMISVLRSLYELAFVFHNIYAGQDSLIEREIVLNLWKVRGLNNRQNLQFVPLQFQDKEKNEKMHIDAIKNKIITLANELELPESIMTQLKKVVMSKSVDIKGYKFRKEQKSSKIISFDGFRFEQGAETIFGESQIPWYRFLSIQGHPSYLGVLQFGQMYNGDEDKEDLKTILTCASKLASTIAIDFRDNIVGAKDVYEKLREKEKSFIQASFNS